MTRRGVAFTALFCALAMLSGCYWQTRERALKVEALAQAEAARVAAARAEKTEIIIDSDDASGLVEKDGDWPYGEGGGDWGVSGCLFAYQGSGECKLRWRPNLPQDGEYRVSVWFGGDPNSDHATNSPFTVHYEGGTAGHKVDQTQASNGWRVLGTYSFKAGKTGYVELTNDANGNVVADGIKFEIAR